ncbi:MAG TPA: tRNA (adenosine(37)-N6)-threonylcarbamoyltransferase complex ATPase subunit type 1 TsaE [Bacteroidota bacterium]|nr:tRNA (adenosine(37)-N6)-threonylcarbamoyltransferase complex ATPase subunit type 1 TsaE [Bacteroidota bacterium]
MTIPIMTHTAEETQKLGSDFAAVLRRRDVVALYGGLGSGKTQFVKGVCKGLGVRDHVVSPSFTILNEYSEGHFPIYHFDFYRLRSIAELAEIGFEEYLFGEGVCLIEWADLVDSKLRSDRYDVSLELGAGPDERLIRIERVDAA